MKGARAGVPQFADVRNPYDGHTLHEQLEQTGILLEDIGVKPQHVMANLGFCGVNKDNPTVNIIHRGKGKSRSRTQRRWLNRRQAVEPTIGHLKADHWMDRGWLAGALGGCPARCPLCRRLQPQVVDAGSRPLGPRGNFCTSFWLSWLTTRIVTRSARRRSMGFEFCRADYLP